MRSANQLHLRVRWALGASTGSIVVTLTLLVAMSIGGWLAYSHYQALSRANQVETSLATVHRFRGANRVTRARILASALEKLRAAGGRLEPRDITLHLSALTPDNGRTLPRMMRTKLSLACHMRDLGTARDSRIARMKRAFENAGRRPPPAVMRPTRPPAPPDLGGGLGCSADRLAELDYTFVLLTAKARVKSGLVSRTVTVTKKFYLPQPPPASDAADSDGDEGDDDD